VPEQVRATEELLKNYRPDNPEGINAFMIWFKASAMSNSTSRRGFPSYIEEAERDLPPAVTKESLDKFTRESRRPGQTGTDANITANLSLLTSAPGKTAEGFLPDPANAPIRKELERRQGIIANDLTTSPTPLDKNA